MNTFNVKFFILFFQIRCFSSKIEKVIDLSYADIDPVYVPLKNEAANLHDEEGEKEEEVEEKDQYSVDSVRHFNFFDFKIIKV